MKLVKLALVNDNYEEIEARYVNPLSVKYVEPLYKEACEVHFLDGDKILVKGPAAEVAGRFDC